MESLHADSAISRWELSAEEKKWAEGGNKIEAIKLHRKRTSCTLKESKDIIENYIEKYLMDRGDLRRRPLSEMLLRWGRLKDKHDTYNIILGPDDIISIEKELMRPIGPSELKRLLMGLFSGEVKLIKGR